MTAQTFRRGLLVLLAAGALTRLFVAYVWLPGSGFPSDLSTFTAWGLQLSEHGAGNFYATAGFADYPPGYMYVLWFLGDLAHLSPDTVGTMTMLLKLPAIGADLALGALLAAMVWRARKPRLDAGALALLAAALFVFNPLSIYDSALWGQVESVGLLVVLAAVFMLMEGAIELALPLTVLAGLVKPQFGLILVPVVGILVIRRHLLGRPGPRPSGRLAGLLRLRPWARLALGGTLTALVYAAVALPFNLDPGKYVDLVNRAAGTYGYLSVNAYNPWALLALGGHAAPADGGGWVGDNLPFLFGLTAFQVGSLLLLAGLLLAGAIVVWRDDRRSILVAVTVAALAFFVLPTRVHERYLFPVIVFLPLLAITSRRYLVLLVALSAAALLNFHGVLMTYSGAPANGLPFADFAREPWVIRVAALTALTGFLFVLLDSSLARRLWVPALRALGWQRELTPSDPLTHELGILSADFSLTALLLVPSSTAKVEPLAKDPGAPVATQANTFAPSRSGAASRITVASLLWGLLQRFAVDRSTAPEPTTSEPSAAASASAPSDESKPTVSVFRRAWAGLAAHFQSLAAESKADRSYTVHHLDRRDAGLLVLILLLAFVTRFVGVGQPASMYFDEVYHARTATEFLQDWRYGLPHNIYEFTHPHLAKYAMAGGIVLFGGNQVTATSKLAPLRDALVEPRYSQGSDTTKHGERLYLATGTSIEIYALPGRTLLASLPFPATILALDPVGHRLFAADALGKIVTLATRDLERPGTPTLTTLTTLSDPPTALTAAGNGSGLFVQLGHQRLLTLDASGAVTGDKSFAAAITARLPLVDGKLVLASGEGQLQVVGPDLAVLSTVRLSKAVSDLAFFPLDGGKIYATTGAGLEYVSFDAGGSLGAPTTVAMPGSVQTLVYNPSAALFHVLGRTPDGSAETVYVVEPRGNAVFADARLPFKADRLLVDATPEYPGSDPQNVLALASAGDLAVVAAGGNATAWRLPGVLAGSLLLGALFLLGRLLLRRRVAALAAVAFALFDGMFFASARIAMNDIYVTLFIVAAYALFAALWLGRWRGWLAQLLGLPLVGVLLGLALASKWVGLYAIGGVLLLLLVRSHIGRWLLVAGLVGVSGTLGLLALSAGNPAFMILMLGLTTLATVLVARRGPDLEPTSQLPFFLRPGLGWLWAALCLVAVPLAVYALSYLPWVALGNTFFGPAAPGAQNLPDLTVSMYNYHDLLRSAHPASSPWWAWPLDLKPVWFAAQNAAGGLTQQLFDAGNPVVFWMAIPALGFVAWTARRRRDLGLAFLVIAFAAAWLPWARIDRVTFEYHYFSALPFAVLALGALVGELWAHRLNAVALAWARVGAAAVICLPATLWLLRGPLCAFSGASGVENAASVCGPAANAAPLLLLLVALALSLGILSSRVPGGWFGQLVCLAGGGGLLSLVALNAPRGSGLIPAVAALIVSGLLASFILGLRSARALALGILLAAGLVGLAFYPFVAAVPLPTNFVDVWHRFLPSFDYYFQFATNTAPAALGPGLAMMVLITSLIVLNVWGLVRLARAGWDGDS